MIFLTFSTSVIESYEEWANFALRAKVFKLHKCSLTCVVTKIKGNQTSAIGVPSILQTRAWATIEKLEICGYLDFYRYLGKVSLFLISNLL